MAESLNETQLNSDKELLSSWTVVHRDGHTDSSREPTPVDKQDYGSDIEVLHEDVGVTPEDINVTEELKDENNDDTADIPVTDKLVTSSLSARPETLNGASDSAQLLDHNDYPLDDDSNYPEDCYDDELYEYETLPTAEPPVAEDFVPHNQLFVETSRHYIHVRNRTLNTRLNLLVRVAMLFVLAFGLGHYMEWSSRSNNQNYIKNIEDELVSCHADDKQTATDYQTRIDELIREIQELKHNITLTAQQEMDSHGYREELNFLQNENADLKETVAKLRYMSKGSTETQRSSEQLRDLHASPMSELEREEMVLKEKRVLEYIRKNLTPGNKVSDHRIVYRMPPEAPRFIGMDRLRQSVEEYIRKNLNFGREMLDEKVVQTEHAAEAVDDPKVKVGDSIGEVDETKPRVDESAVVVDEPVVDTGETKPRVDDPAVVVDEPVVDIGETKPRVDESAAVVDEPVVDIGETKPRVDDPAVVVDEPVGDIDKTKPRVDDPAVVVDEPVRDIDKTKPRVDKTTAKRTVVEVKPRVDQRTIVAEEPAAEVDGITLQQDAKTLVPQKASNPVSQEDQVESGEKAVEQDDNNQYHTEHAQKSSTCSTLGSEQKRKMFRDKRIVFQEQTEDSEAESPFIQSSNTPDSPMDNVRLESNGRDSLNDKKLNSEIEVIKESNSKEEWITPPGEKEKLQGSDSSEPKYGKFEDENIKIGGKRNYIVEPIEVEKQEWNNNQPHRFHDKSQRKIWKKGKKENERREAQKEKEARDSKPEFVAGYKLAIEQPKLSTDDRKLVKESAHHHEFDDLDDGRVFFGPVNKKKKWRKGYDKKESKHKTDKRKHKEYEKDEEVKEQIASLQEQLKKQQDKMDKIMEMLAEGKNKEEAMANTLTETLKHVSSLIGNLTNSSILRADNIAESTREMFVNFQSMYEDISLPDDVKNKLKDAKDALQENLVSVGNQVRHFLKNTETKDIPKKVGNAFKNTVYTVTKFGKNMLKKAQSPTKAAVKNVVTFVKDWKEILEERWTRVQESFEGRPEKSEASENEYDSGFEEDLNDAEQDLQEEKVWEGVFVDGNNDTQDGDWILKRSSIDEEKEKNSDWVFRRGEGRQKQREEEGKSDWMFDRAHGRRSARDSEDRYSERQGYSEREEKKKKRNGEKKFDDSFKGKRREYMEDHDDDDDDHDDEEDDGEEAYEKYTSSHHRESRRNSNSRRSKKTQGHRGYYHHQTEEEDDDDDHRRYYSSSSDWFYPDVYFQKVQEYFDALVRMYE